jgi:ribosomal protein S18 acetylase RimI-like enzyme
MDSVSLRPMIKEDISIIASWLVTIPLYQRYQLSADGASALLEDALRNQDILLTADHDEKERACGIAWCIVGGAFARSVYLRLIGVRPDRHSAGIGSALLAGSETAAKAFSHDLFLLVSDFNLDAQRFYQKYGYAQIGQIPSYVLPDVSELIYWKRLEESAI